MDFIFECYNFKFSTEEEKLFALDNFEKYLKGDETKIAVWKLTMKEQKKLIGNSLNIKKVETE